MCNAALRRPKREAVVESIRILVFELNRPGRAGVFCFIDAKICWVRPNGHQISNAGTERLYIAELQCFSARNNSGVPRLPAIRGDGKRPGATARPYDLRVHRPHRDQTVRGPAVLRS